MQWLNLACSLSTLLRRASSGFQAQRSLEYHPTLPSSQCKLPQEIIDTIIDLLIGDKATLTQCSLVCRAWVPRSSARLFISFRWPRCRDPQSNAGAKQRKCGGKHCFRLCLQVLTNSSRICGAIEELSLASHNCKRGLDSPEAWRSGGNPIPLDILHSILCLLPRLRRLRIQLCFPTAPLSGGIPRNRRFVLEDVLISHGAESLQTTCDFLTMLERTDVLHLVWLPDVFSSSGFVPTMTQPAPAQPTPALHSLDLCQTSRGLREIALTSILGAVDPNSIHCISTRSPLQPTYITALTPYAASLTTFAYVAHRDFPASALPDYLRPTILYIHEDHPAICIPQLLPQDRSIVMRDLDHLVHAGTQEVYVELPLPMNTLGGHAVHAAHEYLRQSYAALDWQSLGRIFSRCPSFTRLVLGLCTPVWFDGGEDEVTEYAITVTREMAREHLPAWMSEKVVVQKRIGAPSPMPLPLR